MDIIKKTSVLAIFMCLLLIMLPVCFADAVTSVRVYGNNNIDGVVRSVNDVFNVEAKVAASSQPDVKINLGGGNIVDASCSSGVGGYTCTYREDIYTTGDKGRVYVYIDGNSRGRSANYLIDAMAPSIEKLSASQRGDSIIVDYGVRDKAYEGSSDCAEVGKLEFYLDDQLLTSVNIGERPEAKDKCHIEEQISLEGFLGVGEKKITLKAYDKVYSDGDLSNSMHYTEAESDEFTLDSEDPELINISLQKNGAVTTAISLDTGETLDFVAYIKEDNIGKVFADLSSLNHRLTTLKKGTCEQYSPIGGEGLAKCKWSLNIRESGSLSVKLFINDTANNEQIKEETLSVAIDNEPPFVESIRTNHCNADEVCFLGKENDIFIDISESGSGISSENIFVRVLQGDSINPDDCIANVCSITEIGASGAGSVSIDRNSEDNAGNRIDGERSVRFTYDEIDPVINSVTIVNTLGVPVLKEFDELKVVVDASDSGSGIQASDVIGDFSAIGIDEEITASSCDNSTGNYICTFEGINVAKSPVNSGIGITVSDIAGNSKDKREPIKVYRTTEQSRMDYIVTADETLSYLDRRTTAITETPLFFDVKVNKTSSHSREIYNEMVTCAGDSSLISYDLIGNKINHQDYLLRLKFKFDTDEESQKEELKIDCKLSLQKYDASKVYAVPELHSLNLTIPLANNLVDEIGTSVKEKITAAKGDMMMDDEWIGELHKFFEISHKICSLGGTIQKIYTTMEDLKAVVFIIATVLPFGLGESLWNSYAPMAAKMEKFKNNIWGDSQFKNPSGVAVEAGPASFFKQYCAFITCTQCNDPEYEGLFSGALKGNPLVKMKGNDKFQGLASRIAKGVGSKEGQDYAELANIEISNDAIRAGDAYISSRKIISSAMGTEEVDPRKSLIVSLGCFCIPGIIYNLQKRRQIQCRYINCMVDMSKNGQDIEFCDIEKGYNKCLYEKGEQYEILNALLGLNVLRNGLNKFKSILSNPGKHIISALKNTQCKGMQKLSEMGDPPPTLRDLRSTPWVMCGVFDALMMGMDYDGNWKPSNIVSNMGDMFSLDNIDDMFDVEDECEEIDWSVIE